MQHIKPEVITICVGLAASMGAVILCGGAPGKRFSLPNSEILIHQPMGGAEGQAIDIRIAADNIIKTGQILYAIIAKHSGKSIKQVEADCDRDNSMNPEEALKYGLIDKVIKNK
jgi:ATP-dependent Clp protease, protease subunit